MGFIRSNLTLKQQKMTIFSIGKISKKAVNFIKNEVLLVYKCRNYTYGNFTNM